MRALAFGLAAVVFFLGLATIIGYIIDFDRLYKWDGGTGMALNTGLGFIFTGVCLSLLTSRSHVQICKL